MWKTQKPTVQGWWFNRSPKSGKIRLVLIRQGTGHGWYEPRSELLAIFCGIMRPSRVSGIRGEWAGPIEPPTPSGAP
jgi:hypothetical protein